MVTKEVIKILDKYFNTLEIFGDIDKQELIVIVYLMFIDEYYETRLQNSMNDSENPYGLTDCIVKKLNVKVKQLKEQSKLLKTTKLSELPALSHWIIPDIEEVAYFEDNTLYTPGTIENSILSVIGTLTNNVLIL